MKPPSLARVRRNFTALRGDFTPTSRQLHTNFTPTSRQLHATSHARQNFGSGRGRQGCCVERSPSRRTPTDRPPRQTPARALARGRACAASRVSAQRTRLALRVRSTVGSARGDPSAHTNIPNAESTAAHSLVAPFSPTCKVRAARQHAPGDISLTHLRRQLPAIAQAPRTELASYMP